MKNQLTFSLIDRYSMNIWNPALLDNESKSINGEFFFSVIYSVFREISNKNDTINSAARKIMKKFTSEMGKFEQDMKELIKLAELKKAESEFSITFSDGKSHKITFTPSTSGGICPENSLFLRAFIKFDQYVSILNEVKSMAIIQEKEYFVSRKAAQSRLAGIMEGYYSLIKNFHHQRKKYETEMESKKPAAPSQPANANKLESVA